MESALDDFFVECGNCGASGAIRETKKLAKRSWNMRAKEKEICSHNKQDLCHVFLKDTPPGSSQRGPYWTIPSSSAMGPVPRLFYSD